MISITLCMIVKNESQNLSRCLESAKDFVDEIIVVDTKTQSKGNRWYKRRETKEEAKCQE